MRDFLARASPLLEAIVINQTMQQDTGEYVCEHNGSTSSIYVFVAESGRGEFFFAKNESQRS